MADPIAPLHTRQKLRSLGFLENEVTILSLLFMQKKQSAKGISQHTSLSYDAVHYSLNALEKKGLVRRSSENGDDMIEVCSEQEFLQWIDVQKQKNAEIYDEAKGAVEVFLQSVEEANWKPSVMYFEGKQGVIDIYEDILETAKDTYGWHDIERVHEYIGDYVYEFIEKRAAKKITTHAILPDTKVNRERNQESENRQVRFVKELDIEGEIRIYGNKVAVITIEKGNPVGFVFSGKVIVSLFKAIFDQAWSSLA